MKTYPPYPKYKPSGIDWLGEVPDGWDILRLKYLYKEINDRSGTPTDELLSVSQYTGVTLKNDSLDEGKILTNAATLEGYKKVRKGDLVSNIMLAWNGSLGLSPIDGITSPAYGVYRPIVEIESRYFHYLFRTALYKAEFKRNSTGVIESRLRLYTDDFFRIRAMIPLLPEQTTIAQFLDKKTAEIKQFIQLKEKTIELLKERKQAIINQAVTKGLDPMVKMKDSGIEWLGEIPAHWEVKKLKYLFRIAKRIVGKLGYPVLSITQRGIIPKDITSGEGQLSMDYSKYQLIEPGDFGMNHMDLLTGYVDISLYKGVVSPDYRVFQSFNEKVHPDYFLSILQMGYKNKIFYAYGRGSSQLGRWRLPAEEFKNFLAPLPPIEEQRRIIELAITSTKEYESEILNLQKEITLMKEYEQSLISEAVTGKIDVRGEVKME